MSHKGAYGRCASPTCLLCDCADRRITELERQVALAHAMEAPTVTVGAGEYLRVVDEGTGNPVLDRYLPGRYYLQVCPRARRNAGETEGGGRRERADGQ